MESTVHGFSYSPFSTAEQFSGTFCSEETIKTYCNIVVSGDEVHAFCFIATTKIFMALKKATEDQQRSTVNSSHTMNMEENDGIIFLLLSQLIGCTSI